jgi:hypothetical protein
VKREVGEHCLVAVPLYSTITVKEEDEHVTRGGKSVRYATRMKTSNASNLLPTVQEKEKPRRDRRTRGDRAE